MGLVSDVRAVTAAADELKNDTRQRVTLVNDLDIQIETGRNDLSILVEETGKALQDLETFLVTMDLALTASFSKFDSANTALDQRVKALRANLLAELDANDQAVAQLLPQVQISLDLVEKAVGGAATGMSELVAENKRLVELAEKSSDEAETRAQALLATVQSQRDTLQQQANELTGSWDGLESELKTQLTQLQSEFLAVGSAATTSLKGLSEQLATQSTQAQGGAHTA